MAFKILVVLLIFMLLSRLMVLLAFHLGDLFQRFADCISLHCFNTFHEFGATFSCSWPVSCFLRFWWFPTCFWVVSFLCCWIFWGLRWFSWFWWLSQLFSISRCPWSFSWFRTLWWIPSMLFVFRCVWGFWSFDVHGFVGFKAFEYFVVQNIVCWVWPGFLMASIGLGLRIVFIGLMVLLVVLVPYVLIPLVAVPGFNVVFMFLEAYVVFPSSVSYEIYLVLNILTSFFGCWSFWCFL